MILCVGTTPALQRVMVFKQLTTDAVNRARTTQDGPAGKSINVAKVLLSLGEEPLAITLLGGIRGELLARQLGLRHLPLRVIQAECSTRECVTVIDEASNTQTELVEESPHVPSSCLGPLLEAVRSSLPNSQAMVLSGTIAPGLPDDLYLQCLREPRPERCLTILDTQGRPLLETLQGRPDVAKPNRHELAAATGRELTDVASVIDAMKELRARGAQRVVVTAGRQPTIAYDGRQCWIIHPPTIQAVNPIGSGDAFTAAMASRLTRGDDLGEACRWGAAAGTANALTLMPGDLRRGDVERLVKEVRVDRIAA